MSNEWISVQDRLPSSKYQRVIVSITDECEGVEGFVFEANWLDDHFTSNGHVPIATLVTHWQPLPKPPQNEEI